MSNSSIPFYCLVWDSLGFDININMFYSRHCRSLAFFLFFCFIIVNLCLKPFLFLLILLVSSQYLLFAPSMGCDPNQGCDKEKNDPAQIGTTKDEIILET